jgi:hypothetical protein
MILPILLLDNAYCQIINSDNSACQKKRTDPHVQRMIVGPREIAEMLEQIPEQLFTPDGGAAAGGM